MLPHNLKAAGSNPAPATKNFRDIKSLDADRNTGDIVPQLYINATSTFDESPYQKSDYCWKPHSVRGTIAP
jgi:hypothetical protein